MTAVALVAAAAALAAWPSLAEGELTMAPPGASACSGCHGAAVTNVPAITGRDAGEIAAIMIDYKAGRRPATLMNRIAKGFSDSEIRAIAEWIALSRN